MNEALSVDNEVREAIARRASANELHELALSHGMESMLANGIRKAGAGETTVEEVLRAVHE
jgi:general secretion pathway protein E